MGLAEFKVTNITSGRLEIKAYRLVLGPGESVKLAAPLAEEVNWFIGRRFVKVEPLESAKTSKTAPFTLAESPRPMSERKRRGQDS